MSESPPYRVKALKPASNQTSFLVMASQFGVMLLFVFFLLGVFIGLQYISAAGGPALGHFFNYVLLFGFIVAFGFYAALLLINFRRRRFATEFTWIEVTGTEIVIPNCLATRERGKNWISHTDTALRIPLREVTHTGLFLGKRASVIFYSKNPPEYSKFCRVYINFELTDAPELLRQVDQRIWQHHGKRINIGSPYSTEEIIRDRMIFWGLVASMLILIVILKSNP